MQNPLIKFKVNRLYKKDQREKVFRNLDEIRSVLVLFDTHNFNEAAAFIKQLVHAGKSLEAFAYKSKTDLNDYLRSSYTIITEKEASKWFDNTLSSTADKLRNNHYDALFDLSLDRNIFLEYLVLSANADLKIGRNKGKPSPYDMAINLPELELPEETEGGEEWEKIMLWRESKQLKSLTEQIIHYLKTIKSEG